LDALWCSFSGRDAAGSGGARARASVSAREKRREDRNGPHAANAFILGEPTRARHERGASSSARICKAEHPRFAQTDVVIARRRDTARARERVGSFAGVP